MAGLQHPCQTITGIGIANARSIPKAIGTSLANAKGIPIQNWHRHCRDANIIPHLWDASFIPISLWNAKNMPNLLDDWLVTCW